MSGNGTYTTPTGYTLPTTGTVTGTYQWDSSYSGDSNDLAASETGASNEQVKVNPASPSITTTPNTTSGMCGTSETLKDTATIAGAYDPTGTITFTLYSPNDTLLDTETVTINGDGTYSTPRGYSLPSNPARAHTNGTPAMVAIRTTTRPPTTMTMQKRWSWAWPTRRSPRGPAPPVRHAAHR